MNLPEPIPAFCCGDRIKPCEKCGADVWVSQGDNDYGDWCEEEFQCAHCKTRIYIELPD